MDSKRDLVSSFETNNFVQFAMNALRLRRQKPLEDTIVDTEDEIELPEISLEEVANHDSSTDCWIVIYDRIYDVTKFLKLHPGDEYVLLEHAGRDATIAFRGTGHSQEAIDSLSKWQIGQLPEKERIFRCEKPIFKIDLPK
uniref:Putative fatty acid desaturase 2 n=1 Tax=Nyssomyia neivai TaxID=330878 RepID=A0A1L8DYZ1_9DIPT